jgi:hypothetical protein
MKKNILYPASFFVKETPKGIYTSTYPLMFPEGGVTSFETAVYEREFWHPNTKLLFTPKSYLSFKLLDGKSYYEFLRENSINVSLESFDNTENDYSFKVLPITFKNPSDVENSEYSEWAYGFLQNLTKYYNAKLIFFSAYNRTKEYGEKVIVDFVEWWEERGQTNLDKYERDYRDYREGLSNPSNFENPYRDSDKWMDDPGNYWSID